MSMELPLLVLGILVLLLVVMTIRYFFSSPRPKETRHEELRTRHLSHQPWDSADGRANR